jgi:hypothetical protein
MATTLVALLIDARNRLGVSQGGLGELLGSSRRSGQRWEGGGSSPMPKQLHALAAMVHPKDAKLAEQIAVAGGSTLEQLGIVPPPPPPAPPPRTIPLPRPPPAVSAPAPAPPPPQPPPPPEDVVDAVVCAAAEAIDVMPRTIRPALLAAFRRARRLGLDVATVEKALGGDGGEAGKAGSPKKTEIVPKKAEKKGS